jgi:hypothetical protein
MEIPKNLTEDINKVSDALDEILISIVHDDQPDLDRVLACCAEMRGYLVMATHRINQADMVLIEVEHDQQRVYADEVFKPGDTPRQFTDDPKPGKLPKLKPQGHDKPKYKPGIGKLFKGAINFDCPTCKADAFTSCFKFEGPGAHPKLTNERNDGTFYHRKRQDQAKAYNDKIRKANILP